MLGFEVICLIKMQVFSMG